MQAQMAHLILPDPGDVLAMHMMRCVQAAVRLGAAAVLDVPQEVVEHSKNMGAPDMAARMSGRLTMLPMRHASMGMRMRACMQSNEVSDTASNDSFRGRRWSSMLPVHMSLYCLLLS